MAKGSDFERWFSVQLSEWWTNGERQDIFWRSTTSGARATTRKKKGKRTAGSAGDITAIDPIGNAFTRLLVIEVKNGYSQDSIHDIFDAGGTFGYQRFEKWYTQIIEDQEINETPFWCLTWKRVRRKPMIFMPNTFYRELHGVGCRLHDTSPQMKLTLEMETNRGYEMVGIFGVPLENFFEEVIPQDILTIYEEQFGHKPYYP